MKVQDFIESLCILYLLLHRSLYHQRGCADLLFIITKPSTTKWANTDSSTLTYTTTRHTKGWVGYFVAQGDKPWLISDCFMFGLYTCAPPSTLQLKICLLKMVLSKEFVFCPLCFVSYDPAMFSRWFLLISDVHWCVLNASLFFSSFFFFLSYQMVNKQIFLHIV